ncbi:MAG: helix-turn-helix transcriptional regulator [Lachnospiraceae bacterium]|nr:helix-turn-helix transcriptional regulator [Lachnospiraceae bacterium]
MLSLKQAREAKKLTQKEAAKLLGISVDALGNYERGKTYPDVPILRKIEELYGIPYDRLIFLPLDYDKVVNKI